MTHKTQVTNNSSPLFQQNIVVTDILSFLLSLIKAFWRNTELLLFESRRKVYGIVRFDTTGSWKKSIIG